MIRKLLASGSPPARAPNWRMPLARYGVRADPEHHVFDMFYHIFIKISEKIRPFARPLVADSVLAARERFANPYYIYRQTIYIYYILIILYLNCKDIIPTVRLRILASIQFLRRQTANKPTIPPNIHRMSDKVITEINSIFFTLKTVDAHLVNHSIQSCLFSLQKKRLQLRRSRKMSRKS